MKKLLTLLFLSPLMAYQVKAQVPSVLEVKLQDTLEDMKARFGFRGLSAAVSFKGMGIWKSAVGESQAGTPLAPDMLIGIGSNTKTFVSAMMVKLSESGRVSLTDTIGKWISGYDNINGAVTIRQVLNHTSGFNSYTDNVSTWDSINKDLGRIWTKDEILHKFVGAPSFAPGASWEYSNTNYIIAGLIEEKITGRTIQQLLRDSIMTPNALNHTFFPPYETATDPYAHLWTDWDGDGTLDDVGEYSTSTMLRKEINSIADAAGGLVSTAEDNVKFWEALMHGKIISKTSLRNDFMKWTGFGSAASEYGLGIMRSRYLAHTVFSHGGTWIGQINENMSDTAENIFITVLSNQDSMKNDVVARVVQGLYKVTLDYKKLAVDEFSSAANNLSVYPNPARELVYISDSRSGDKLIRVLDIYGRLVLEQYVNSAAPSIPLSTGGLVPGTYMIQVIAEQVTATAKLVIAP